MNDYFLKINMDGVFLGNKPADTYRGEKLDKHHIQDAIKTFTVESDILSRQQYFSELYVMTSETSGIFSIAGNPSIKHGKYIWARVKKLGGTVSDWTYLCEHKNPSDAAKYAICSVMTGINLGVLFEQKQK